MIRSPAGPGTIGQPSSRSLAEELTYARHLTKATSAAAAARAGIKMSKKYNTESTKKFRMRLTHKPTSSQAAGNRKRVHKLRVQASSLSQQAQGSGSPDKVGSAQAQGSRQQGQKYFFYVECGKIFGAGRSAQNWVF